MIYKFISSQQAVAKILTDLDIGEESIRISDIKEWIGEAVEKIGSVRQFNRKVSGTDDLELLEIDGYQVQLPTDLHKLNRVAYSASPTGAWIPMALSSGSFNVFSTENLPPVDYDADPAVPAQSIIELAMYIYSVTYEVALAMITADAGLRARLNTLMLSYNKNNNDPSYGLKYSIKPGFINVNIDKGWIKLSYDAINLDDDGYPMIPDLVSYMEAIYWYVVMKLKYPEYLAGRMNREIYYDIRRSWNFYCKQAYGESLMPNEDEMESIKRSWNSILPDFNSGDIFYSNIGETNNTKNPTR